MNIRILNKRMLLATTVAAGSILAAACGGSAPEAVEIPVDVTGEAMDPGTIRVKQGDMVTLKINAEESGEFHLHGYDIEQDIDEDGVADLYFAADATGRFRITFHHTGEDEDEKEEKEGDHGHDDEEGKEVDIGFLEVGPR
jgi:plastocyanin